MNRYTLTKAECRYKLCGIITAPTIPTACKNSRDPQFEHHGMNMPSSTSIWEGPDTTY